MGASLCHKKINAFVCEFLGFGHIASSQNLSKSCGKVKIKTFNCISLLSCITLYCHNNCRLSDFLVVCYRAIICSRYVDDEALGLWPRGVMGQPNLADAGESSVLST